MDLSRIALIEQSSLEDLQSQTYVEDLIVKLGFNTEILREQPRVVRENGGGLLIWQYPNQFSKYLLFLQKIPITSYIEIGCRWGGTFVLTTEYLKKFNTLTKSVAVDLIDSPVAKYCMLQDETRFLKSNSQSAEFKSYMQRNKFDLIFIDGDHSYEGVKSDFEISKNSGKIFVFHDIYSSACPGVVKFWNEVKSTQEYDCTEFVDQYQDVWDTTHQMFLGIGVAIRKSSGT